VSAIAIGRMIELAGKGTGEHYPGSGAALAGFIQQLPELCRAFSGALRDLAGFMDSSGLAGEAGELVAEAGIAASAAAEAGTSAWIIFEPDCAFWLDDQPPVPDPALTTLTGEFEAGLIPEQSDHLITFLQRFPELAQTLADGIRDTAEWMSQNSQGGRAADLIAEVALHLGMVAECADSAWGAFEDAHAFWLATRR
jgi:hypothetical protein